MSPPVFEEGNSKFYVEGVDLSSSDEQPDSSGGDLQGQQGHHHDLFLPEIVAENLNMTVKLPDNKSATNIEVSNNGQHVVDTVDASGKTRPCRFAGCDFYGTPEMHYLCSKCFAKVENPRSKGGVKKVY